MRSYCMNCGGLFLAGESNMQKKRSLPTKQVSGKAPSREEGAKYSRRDSATGEGSHSSSVHRGIIPLSPPHTQKKNPAPLISPARMQLQMISASHRERWRPLERTGISLSWRRSVTTSKGHRRVNFSTHLTGSIDFSGNKTAFFKKKRIINIVSGRVEVSAVT